MGVTREPFFGDSPAGVGLDPVFEDRKPWKVHGFSFCSAWAGLEGGAIKEPGRLSWLVAGSATS